MPGTTSQQVSQRVRYHPERIDFGANSNTFQQECNGDENLQPGQVLWHFVLTQTTALNGWLRAEFQNAKVTVPEVSYYKHVGGVLHWNVITSGGPDILLNASTDALGDQLNLSHVCRGDNLAATSSITTELHKYSEDLCIPVVIPVDSEIDLGSTLHDSAGLTTTLQAGLPVGSFVTFRFFSNDSCEGDAADTSSPFDVSGVSNYPSVIDPALSQGPLGAGSYSYNATFTSGDTNVVLGSTSDCEPFKVKKANTQTATQVHDANHADITNKGISALMAPAMELPTILKR